MQFSPHTRRASLAERGFTLTELLISLAIISILSAMAVPAYQDFVTRSRVTEGLSLVSSAKAHVAELAQSGNDDAADGYRNGYAPPTATQNVAGIQIEPATGAITVSYTQRAGNGTLVVVPYTGNALALPDATAAFTPVSGAIRWRCNAEGSVALPGPAPQVPATLSARYAPSECR